MNDKQIDNDGYARSRNQFRINEQYNSYAVGKMLRYS